MKSGVGNRGAKRNRLRNMVRDKANSIAGKAKTMASDAKNMGGTIRDTAKNLTSDIQKKAGDAVSGTRASTPTPPTAPTAPRAPRMPTMPNTPNTQRIANRVNTSIGDAKRRFGM